MRGIGTVILSMNETGFKEKLEIFSKVTELLYCASGISY